MDFKKGDRVIIGPDMQQSMERYRGRKATIIELEHYSHTCWIRIDQVSGPFGHDDPWCARKDHLLPLEFTNRTALSYLKR